MRRVGWGGALIAALAVTLGGVGQVEAQDSESDRLRVFFDCNAMGCDRQYVVREITWVDWVNDRQVADVHLLVTFTSAGAGFSYDIAFIGQGDFEGQDLDMSVFSSNTDTNDERRERLAGRYELGLASYAAETEVGNQLAVSFNDPNARPGGPPPQAVTPENDPWDLWVFRVGVGGGGNGESTFRSLRGNANASANRISDQWKFTSNIRFDYNENEFDVSDSLTIKSFRRSSSLNLLLVKSLGPQWGLGGRANISSSTFANHDLRFSVVPALEFNIFPYSESSRRSFTLQYRAGPEYVRYDQTTIFEKDEEWLYRNALEANISLQQPWGGASLSLSGEAFLDDWQKNALSAFGNLRLRIVRGLDFNIFGSISRIRNRVNEPGTDASEQDILLRQRILGTSISYNFNIGLSYRFGSIFNNIVNPRLGGGGGFFFF